MDSGMTLITEGGIATYAQDISDVTENGKDPVTTQVHLKIRRKTQAQWEASSEVPLEGEPCMATDSFQFKIGDGKNVWTALRLAWGSVDDGELS